MSRDLHPTVGARFLLERTDHTDTTAVYTASIYTPDAVFTTIARVADDGTAQLAPTGAPAELDERLTIIAKLLARDATTRREGGLVVWPVRVLRWRK